MKRTVIASTAISIAVMLWPAAGRAQLDSQCKPFQGIAQAGVAQFDAVQSTGREQRRLGRALLWMLGTEFVAGILSGNDGEKSANGNIGQGLKGSYTVGFNCTGGLGGTYACADTFTYEVPIAVWTRPPGFGRYVGSTAKIVAGTGRFGSASGYLIGTYACADTFTYEVPIAVWTRPPGFGRYVGSTAKIVAGTGRFGSASGYLIVYGVFGGWPDTSSRIGMSGRWNPEISGQICGVQ